MNKNTDISNDSNFFNSIFKKDIVFSDKNMENNIKKLKKEKEKVKKSAEVNLEKLKKIVFTI